MFRSRFFHEELLRGENYTDKIANKRIIVCGCGTNGSNLVENLVKHGFQNICVIDYDRVEEHNLGPQVFGEPDIGYLKVEAIRDRIYSFYGVEIDIVHKKLDEKNCHRFVKNADLVVDCFDNHRARLLLTEYCKQRGFPLLHLGVIGDYGEVVWNDVYRVPQDQAEGDNCDYPLARNLALLVVVVATEEILDFFLNQSPRRKSWSITLRDFNIGSY